MTVEPVDPMFERIVIESIPSSILIVNRNLEVVYANKHYLTISMKRKKDVLGKPIDKVLSRVSFERMKLDKKIKKVFDDGLPFEGGHVPGERLGRIFFYKLMPLITESGDGNYAVIFIEDVTELTRLEGELKESYGKLEDAYAELKAGDKVKSEFISVISHELRTPVTVLHGYLELFETGHMGELTKKQKEKLEIMKLQTDHMKNMINEMLDLSKMESRKFEIAKEKVSITKTVKETVKMIETLADMKGHTITIDVPPSLPELIGDEKKVARVLVNLLVNAIKYTPNGGRINIGAKDRRNDIEISVADTGIGIPKCDQKRIFEKFYTLKGTSSISKPGKFGLGLYISKGIVNAHDGKIWVESKEGKGSTFYVTLPKNVKEQTTHT